MESSTHRPLRRTMDLVRGRATITGARYFVTLCAAQRKTGLTAPAPGKRLSETIASVFASEDASLLCATLMPDHVHLLFALETRLDLSRLMAKFKTLSHPALPAGLAWQRNFFEHRLRPGEQANDYARYVFMNPYRKGLLDRIEAWPHWMLGAGIDFDFLHGLEAGRVPPAEWLETDGDLLPPALRSSKTG